MKIIINNRQTIINNAIQSLLQQSINVVSKILTFKQTHKTHIKNVGQHISNTNFQVRWTIDKQEKLDIPKRNKLEHHSSHNSQSLSAYMKVDIS